MKMTCPFPNSFFWWKMHQFVFAGIVVGWLWSVHHDCWRLNFLICESCFAFHCFWSLTSNILKLVMINLNIYFKCKTNTAKRTRHRLLSKSDLSTKQQQSFFVVTVCKMPVTAFRTLMTHTCRLTFTSVWKTMSSIVHYELMNGTKMTWMSFIKVAPCQINTSIIPMVFVTTLVLI